MFGLGFLAPAFLAGLLAVAVPIALHLFRRRTDRVIEFPAAQMLPQAPGVSASSAARASARAAVGAVTTRPRSSKETRPTRSAAGASSMAAAARARSAAQVAGAEVLSETSTATMVAPRPACVLVPAT